MNFTGDFPHVKYVGNVICTWKECFTFSFFIVFKKTYLHSTTAHLCTVSILKAQLERFHPSSPYIP